MKCNLETPEENCDIAVRVKIGRSPISRIIRRAKIVEKNGDVSRYCNPNERKNENEAKFLGKQTSEKR